MDRLNAKEQQALQQIMEAKQMKEYMQVRVCVSRCD